jgi:hypothetical protein
VCILLGDLGKLVLVMAGLHIMAGPPGSGWALVGGGGVTGLVEYGGFRTVPCKFEGAISMSNLLHECGAQV